MSIDLDAIRRRADAATPGPWTVYEGGRHVAGWDLIEVPRGTRGMLWYHADAEFIAASRSDVPALLDEVERLRAALDMLTIDAAGRRKERDAVVSVAPRPDGVWLSDAEFQSRVVELAEARAIIADLYALACHCPPSTTGRYVNDHPFEALRDSVAARCLPEEQQP